MENGIWTLIAKRDLGVLRGEEWIKTRVINFETFLEIYGRFGLEDRS